MWNTQNNFLLGSSVDLSEYPRQTELQTLPFFGKDSAEILHSLSYPLTTALVP